MSGCGVGLVIVIVATVLDNLAGCAYFERSVALSDHALFILVSTPTIGPLA